VLFTEITVFWNVTNSYHLSSPLKVEAVGFAEMLVSTYQPKTSFAEECDQNISTVDEFVILVRF
jgi:hypothetical protein